MTALRAVRTAGNAAGTPADALRATAGAPAPALAERILAFQASALAHASFAEAAAAFATELAAALGFDRAAIGFAERGRSRVVATSHTADFQPNTALFTAFSAAMDEAIDQGATLTFPPRPGRPLVTLANAALARRYGGAACTVPLVQEGRAFGAITLVREDPTNPGEAAVELLEHLACFVGPLLALKREAERPWHERLTAAARKRLSALAEPGHARAKIAAAAAAALAAFLLFVPVQYRVGAQARVEGAVQRALVAPADGFLRQVHARPGDRVKADQVLAELVEEDLKLERRRWQSELAQHENAASAALARADRAQFAVSDSKADEARAQLDLVERHLSRARVVAPFDGVVIKGDLTQSLGAPVRRGDVLLTVAPHDRYRLVIEVDERDITDVEIGRTGRFSPGALDRSFGFRVTRVTPVTTNRDARNFFEVEGELDQGAAALRPGLQGVAKIEAGRQSLAWIWTHKLADWLRLTLWSWGL